MNLNNSLRNQAKLDSRRFGKAIVCRIVHGPLLAFMKVKRLTPRGIIFNERYGLDPKNNRMIVIPVTKYAEIDSLFKNLNNVITEQQKNDDFESFEKHIRSEESLVRAITQNMVLVTVDFSSLPEGQKAGAEPSGYDVLIDSLDVNQNIRAEYVFRNVANLGDPSLKWNK